MSVAIPPAGIHRLTDRQYFALDLPSSSTTKVLLGAPNAKLAYERDNPREDTDDLTVGAYVHALCLDPDSVDDNFLMVGEINRRTKEGKAEWDAVQSRAERTGARVLTADLREKGELMAHSVLNHPSATAILRAANEREVTVIGDIGGLPAKAKIDAIASVLNGDGSVDTVVIDIKTTQSADPRTFAADAAKFGYFHQAAWYTRLLRQHRTCCEEFVIIAVEKNPPYLVAVFRIPSVAVSVADHKIDAVAERWWAVQAGDRTGYPQDIVELEPPKWWLIGE
jgi:exodeoxyribonuclease VIII